MELAAELSPREVGLDLLAAHLAGLDLDHVQARDRLERVIGAQLAQFLLSALGSHPFP